MKKTLFLIWIMCVALVGKAQVDFTVAAEKSVNAVVHIRTEIVTSNTYYDFFGSFLEQIYGNRIQVPDNVSVGFGSGVVISSDGYIVTNNHVVEGARKIEVTFNDKHKREAEVVGTDPTTDIALIKVDAQDLEYLTFGDSDKVRVGEWVLAVGNPFNLTSTVTAGIVSAKARNINILGAGTIESFIQTDAAVNPGNSGGALVNTSGDLIGINAAIASRTGSYEGYSFAIPSNIAKKVVEDFLLYGSLQRAYLGIAPAEITEELAKQKNLNVMTGVYVDDVYEGGAAQKAGIKNGDIILSINDITVDTRTQLIGAIGQFRPGDKVVVKVLRGENERDFNVTLANMHGTESIIKGGDRFYNEQLGLVLEPLSQEMKKAIKTNYGLRIVEVKDGVFKRKGLNNDYIILVVNNQKVSSEKELNAALKNSRNGKIRIEMTDVSSEFMTIFEFYDR
ncbi:MAG: Do family serine endopeptidase [Bacteroidales bacterium]|nr:Do family serine endopeptidase [Bacteroidales bacterium]